MVLGYNDLKNSKKGGWISTYETKNQMFDIESCMLDIKGLKHSEWPEDRKYEVSGLVWASLPNFKEISADFDLALKYSSKIYGNSEERIDIHGNLIRF